METTLVLLRTRLDESARTTLRDIVSGSLALRTISRPLSRLLCLHQAAIRTELSSAGARRTFAAAMARGFLAYLLDRYQYIRPSAQDEARIMDAYSVMVDVAARDGGDLSESIETVLPPHHDRLQAITVGMLSAIGALDDVLHGADPICRQYSPALQCEVLGLTGDDLAGPLLDIGCGEAAALVGFLRARDCPAWGIDRLAPGHGHALPGDWFQLPTVAGGWRTIVAHLSFSLHFVHAHLHAASEAKRYALAYKAILDRLQPGGSFIYTPSLPFIEPLLDPRQFQVTTRPVPMPSGQLAAASRVTRLA